MNSKQHPREHPELYELKETLHAQRLVGIWRLMRGYRWIYAAAVLFVALATLARTGIYYLLRYFVDEVLTLPNLNSVLPWLALAFIGLAATQGGFTYFSGRWAAYTAEGVARRIRDYVYDHLQRLTFTYHDQTQTGELIQRATSDVDAVRMFFADQAIGFGRITLMFAVNFLGIYLLNSYLAWMSIIVIPFVVGLSIYFFKVVGETFEAFQEQEAVLSNRFQENISGVRVVKAFARQDYEIDRFDVENEKKKKLGMKFGLLHGTFWPLTDIMCAFQMVFGFWLGATMAIDGVISTGTFLAYAGMVVQIIWPIRNLGRLITQMSTAIVSFGRLSDIINQEKEPLAAGTHHPDDDVRGHIQFEQVHFAYEAPLKADASAGANTVGRKAKALAAGAKVESGLPVLHDISFEVQPGQVVALLGATGSGKSSLVNLLPRFYEYTAGEIRLDDQPLRTYTREYLRRQIGVVMQEPFLFSRSIRDNITYGVGRVVSDEEVHAAARAAAVHDVIESFPKGYGTMVGERGVTLSGGQKQRVTLARTILRDPRILILDDATSSVDTETESHIRAALNRLMENRTTFIIAHRVQSVMTADLILVMEDGRIVQRGTHDELVNRDGIYRRVYTLQAQIEDDLEHELADTDPSTTPATKAPGRNGRVPTKSGD